MTTEPLQKALNEILSALHINKQTPVRALKFAYVSAVALLIVLTISTHLILKKQILESNPCVIENRFPINRFGILN